MKEIEIIGQNYKGTCAHTRVACRALVFREGKLLLSHETNTGWWTIPGGGIEENETIAACCAREVLEETGYVVTPAEPFLTIREYYSDWCYISHYFLCEVTGQGKRNLTQQELERGLIPEWVDFDEARAIFGAHESYAGINEEMRGLYQREYLALCRFREI